MKTSRMRHSEGNWGSGKQGSTRSNQITTFSELNSRGEGQSSTSPPQQSTTSGVPAPRSGVASWDQNGTRNVCAFKEEKVVVDVVVYMTLDLLISVLYIGVSSVQLVYW